jgi:hypothetical protein
MFKALASERRTTTRSKSIRDEDAVMVGRRRRSDWPPADAAGRAGRVCRRVDDAGAVALHGGAARAARRRRRRRAPPPVPVEVTEVPPVASTKKAEPLDSILDDLDGLERKQGQTRRAAQEPPSTTSSTCRRSTTCSSA